MIDYSLLNGYTIYGYGWDNDDNLEFYSDSLEFYKDSLLTYGVNCCIWVSLEP